MQIKKLLSMSLLIPSLAVANELVSIQTVCVDVKELTAVTNNFKEIPFVRAISNSFEDGTPNSMVIFVNAKTGSFTVTQRQEIKGRTLYCVLAAGDRFEPVPKKIQDEIIEQQNKGNL